MKATTSTEGGWGSGSSFDGCGCVLAALLGLLVVALAGFYYFPAAP